MIKSTIYLFNINQVQNQNTGKRENVVEKTAKIIGEIGQVGTTTFWNATSENIALSHTVQINYKSFDNEKYLAFRSKGKIKVLTVNNTAAGIKPHLIKIHCTETKKDIEDMILKVMENEIPAETTST